MPLSMIHRLVQSAFQTGYLSVKSEGLIRQMIAIRSYQATDLSALKDWHQAIYSGQVKREVVGAMSFGVMMQA